MPKYLTLKGQKLECNETMPVGLFFDLAEGMDGDDMIKAVAVMSRTIKAIVAEKDRKALQEILHRTSDPLSFDELNEALGNVIPEYTKRPTAPASSSQAGPSVPGGTSRRVSLSVLPSQDPGEEGEATSSKDGQSAAS